jgi:hypothetical protein
MATTPITAASRLGLLRALAQRMESYEVEADVRTIATLILETARDLDWAHHPQGVSAWLSQLALELAQTSPVRKTKPANLALRS